MSNKIERENIFQPENRKNFLDRINFLDKEDIQNIDFAYDLAKESHRPQKRDSGERYFEHVRSVAIILIDECQILDPNLIISALLHDSIEDTAIFGNATKEYSLWKKTASYRLSKTFNSQIAEHVITLTKPKVDGKEIMTKEQAIQIYLDNLKKADPDTILIKMCDRLHNLRSLSGTTPEKQIRTCKETREKYFSIFELVKEKYPNQYQYLINQMNQEIAKFIS